MMTQILYFLEEHVKVQILNFGNIIVMVKNVKKENVYDEEDVSSTMENIHNFDAH